MYLQPIFTEYLWLRDKGIRFLLSSQVKKIQHVLNLWEVLWLWCEFSKHFMKKNAYVFNNHTIA